jgi:hypothetical protein
MGKTLGIICTINPLGERLRERFQGKDTVEGTADYSEITVANPKDVNFTWDRQVYLVHLSEIKSRQMRQLYAKNPDAKVIAFSGKLRNRNFYGAKYPNVEIHDTAVSAWEACEREAPRTNPY